MGAVGSLAGMAGIWATAASSHGPGFGYWHGDGHWGMERSMDPAAIDQRVERGIKHLAVEIDATKEQQDKLIAIAKAAAKDLLPFREKMQAARRQGVELFGQPTVDRAAIEKYRADQLASADEVSRRIAKAVAEAADVLTPEQRRKIADRWPPFGGWHGRWHRG